jgi:hypothetical protein
MPTNAEPEGESGKSESAKIAQRKMIRKPLVLKASMPRLRCELRVSPQNQPMQDREIFDPYLKGLTVFGF